MLYIRPRTISLVLESIGNALTQSGLTENFFSAEDQPLCNSGFYADQSWAFSINALASDSTVEITIESSTSDLGLQILDPSSSEIVCVSTNGVGLPETFAFEADINGGTGTYLVRILDLSGNGGTYSIQVTSLNSMSDFANVGGGCSPAPTTC